MGSQLFATAPSGLETFLFWYGEHWMLGTILVLFAFLLLAWPFRILNGLIRSRNIRKHGWPPAHLDADGDFKRRRGD